jgi:sigma-B regulation protein RsbU (phosphoserine phosphatase)
MLRHSLLARFLRQQALYLAIAVVGYAVFLAIGLPMKPAPVILYSLCFGNLVTPSMNRIRCRFSGQSPAHRWLIFLAALAILTPIVYATSSVVVVWIAPPYPQSLEHLIRTGWKFPCLMIFVYGVISLLFFDTKERLERRNAELQLFVERSTAQLEMQDQELQRAREIQESLLPTDIPQIPGFEVAAAWQPAQAVGGDYFDVLRLSKNRLGICIADVSGKGVSAALLMANVQATVRAFARDTESPARVCSRVNSVLCGNIASGKFVSFFYGVLDADQRTLEYCNAGHPCPVVVSRNNVQQLPAGGAVLGVFPAWTYENATIALAPGDRLLLFTDGITEACGPNGEEFGEEKLADGAKIFHTSSAPDLNGKLLTQVTDFCESHFQDDATLLVIAASSTATLAAQSPDRPATVESVSSARS